MALVEQRMKYEVGELEFEDAVMCFSVLAATGAVGSLQGHYGLSAATLVGQGWLSPSGKPLWGPFALDEPSDRAQR